EDYSLIKVSNDRQYASVHRLVQKVGRLRNAEIAVKGVLERFVRVYNILESELLYLDAQSAEDRKLLSLHTTHTLTLQKLLSKFSIGLGGSLSNFNIISRIIYLSLMKTDLSRLKPQEKTYFLDMRKTLESKQKRRLPLPREEEINDWCTSHGEETLFPRTKFVVGQLWFLLKKYELAFQ